MARPCHKGDFSQQADALPQEIQFQSAKPASRIGIEGVEQLPLGRSTISRAGDRGRQPLGQLRLAGGDGPRDGHVAGSGVQMFQQPGDAPADYRVEHRAGHLGRRLKTNRRHAMRGCGSTSDGASSTSSS